MSSIGRRAFARILLLASAVVFTGACDSNPPTLAPETPRATVLYPWNYYVIRNVASGKVLDVERAGCCNGYWVHQWTYEGLKNQQWRVVEVGGGYYKIVARHSGRVLDVRSASLSDGAVIHQWDYQGLANQQWHVVSGDGGDTWLIVARHSGKLLTATGMVNGAGVRQYGAQDSPTQLWRLEQVY